MNIVVSNVKGGVGKTTTAVYLAAVAGRRGRGPVVLVDADPQGSTAEWYDADPLEGVELVEGPSVRTVGKAMNLEDGIVVVDTPPGEGTVVQAALGRADAVVIPTRAGGVEPNRVVATLAMTPRNVPAGVVICSAPTVRTTWTRRSSGGMSSRCPSGESFPSECRLPAVPLPGSRARASSTMRRS